MLKIDNLSVLIVTWNGDDLLKNCLDSVSRVYGDSLEIVVVDNANLESTKNLVSCFKNTKYIPSETNLGFAGGNNLGLPLCTRKFVLLLNNDTLIHEDSFNPLIDYMERNPAVAVTQGRMRLSNLGNVLDECGIMLTPAGVPYDAYMMRNDSISVPTRPVHSVKGAMMMIRKDVIPEAGGLFYDHFHCNFEEKDFCHRVWMVGYEVHYVDTPPIDHLQSQTIARLNQIEVAGKTLANNIFSICTAYEYVNAAKTTASLILLHLAVGVFSAFKGNINNIRQLLYCLKSLLRRRSELKATRYILQSRRKISDKELFKKTMSRPDMRYYYHFFKGSLLNYKLRKE